MTLFKSALLLLALTSCGVDQTKDKKTEMIKVDSSAVPKTVIFETDATGNSVAYYLMNEDLNAMAEKDFSQMSDTDVESLIGKLTQNKLRVASSSEDLSSEEFSVSEASLSSVSGTTEISYYRSPYSYSNGYSYNPSYGNGYNYGAGVGSSFGSASGYARGYGSGYNAGSGYSRGYDNGYESSHESAGEAEGRVSGGGEIGGSLNLGWLNLGFKLGFNYDLGYKFGYNNKSYSVYRPGYQYGNGSAYGSRY
jgi:hypothetical protein